VESNKQFAGFKMREFLMQTASYLKDYFHLISWAMLWSFTTSKQEQGFLTTQSLGLFPAEPDT
jgi:hypothetical protein